MGGGRGGQSWGQTAVSYEYTCILYRQHLCRSSAGGLASLPLVRAWYVPRTWYIQARAHPPAFCLHPQAMWWETNTGLAPSLHRIAELLSRIKYANRGIYVPGVWYDIWYDIWCEFFLLLSTNSSLNEKRLNYLRWGMEIGEYMIQVFLLLSTDFS